MVQNQLIPFRVQRITLEVIKLQEFSHDDPALQQYKDSLEPYVGGYNARNVPYQVFIHDDSLVGIVVVSEEPVRLIEPIGTLVSIVLPVDYTKQPDVLNEFAEAALRIAEEHGAAYSFIDIPDKYDSLIDHFLNIGYTQVAHSLRMQLRLDEYEKKGCNLRVEKVNRDEVEEFLERLKEFMRGSEDNILNIVLDNIQKLPEQFLDHWYNSTELYYVFNEEKLVGILELSPQTLNIANIGVNSNHRQKGYGKEIMKYALDTLKDKGTEFARLRVHAKNNRAIGLYESFGMSRGNSYKALLWRR